MKKCYLNNEIQCNFVTICQKETETVLPFDRFLYYSKLFAGLHYRNIHLMKYLLSQGHRNELYDHFYTYLRDVLDFKKKIKSVLGNKFYYYITYDSYNKFQLHVSKERNKLVNSNILYPSCCTDVYLQRNGEEGKKELGYSEIFKQNYNKSLYFCPLMKYNFSLTCNGDINFPFFPYYEMCGFDCQKTVQYIDNIYSYITGNTDIKEIFLYNKGPTLLYHDYLFSFNGFYKKGIIYYNGLIISSFDEIGTYKKKTKLHIDNIQSKYIVLPGMFKKIIPDTIQLKYMP